MTLPPSYPRGANGEALTPTRWDAANHQMVFGQAAPGTADSSTPAVVYGPDYEVLHPQYHTGIPILLPYALQKVSAKSSGNVGSIPAAFTIPNGINNTIVVVCGNGNNGTLSVTDSNGNTYNSTSAAANSTTFETQIFWAPVTVGGPSSAINTVTVANAGTAASMAVEIYEVPGLLVPVPGQPDQTATNTGTGTTASTSAITPTYPNEYVFSGIAVGTAAQTITPGTGWTNDSGQQNPATPSGLFSFVSMSQFRAGISSLSPSATIGSSEPWAMTVVSFRPIAMTIDGKVSLAVAGTMTTAPADSMAVANAIPATQMQQSGTGLVSPRRVITKFIQLDAQSITHATPVSVYTPTSGKKWRMLGYNISTTVAGAIQFEDTTGNEVLRTPLLLAAAPFASGDMGNGILSSAANNQLFLDVTVTGVVTGWIGIMEE